MTKPEHFVKWWGPHGSQVVECELDVRVAGPQDTIQDVARTMKTIDAGVIPVCDGDRLLGMVTDRDIVLRAVPARLGWIFEWIADSLGLLCCLLIAWHGTVATLKSYLAGSMSIKTLITPEWWLLAPLPVAFVLLSIEMVFRMRRLYLGEHAPRDDAVSTG